MRTAHLRKIDLAVLAGLLLLSIIVVTLGARLIEAQAATASALGAGWQCHRLLNVEVCDRIGASPPAVAPVRGVELACEGAPPCGSACATTSVGRGLNEEAPKGGFDLRGLLSPPEG
jgi:hypothetical protein